MKDLSYIPSIAAAAALLSLSACATGGGQAQQDVASLRAEVRTLQRENADLVKRVDSMATQIDVLNARSARTLASTPAEHPAAAGAPARAQVTAAAPSAPPGSPAPSTFAAVAGAVAGEETVVIPSHLKVVRLEQTGKTAAPKPVKDAAPPPVPVATPIQEPSASTLAALGGAKSSAADAQSAFDRARAQSGLARARAMEQFADAYPANARAGDALVDAARGRLELGDPDGSCEDFSRAVAEYPASRAMPDALEGLAACESRRGRTAEASRLQTRLAKDFPDSPAGKRAREHAPPVQGAAP